MKWTTANICQRVRVSSECFDMDSYLWLYVWLIASLWSSYWYYLWRKLTHRGRIRNQQQQESLGAACVIAQQVFEVRRDSCSSLLKHTPQNQNVCQQEICGHNGPGPKDLCQHIPYTVQSHKTPETEHGLAVKKYIFGQPIIASPARTVHIRVPYVDGGPPA